jgi:hypothetical protein
MGRLEKQKRKLIEESNKRMLGESIRVKVTCEDDNGNEIPCPKPPTILEKLSTYGVKNDIKILYDTVRNIETKLGNIKCGEDDTTEEIPSNNEPINESIRVKPKQTPPHCQPGECNSQEVMKIFLYLYERISEVTKEAEDFIENQNEWMEKTEWCPEKTN